MSKVRVAIIGVGNCASSLVQGVECYKYSHGSNIPGLMHDVIGNYHTSDIEFSAAFDVVAGKVKTDLSEAIFAEPNNTLSFAVVPSLGVPVSRGATLDGIGKYTSQIVTESDHPIENVTKILKDTGTDVVVNFLPVGSKLATEWYVEQVIEAGCAFVNGIPVFIASSPYWSKRFDDANLPIVGDDVKSQVGATIVHRVLTNLFRNRGVVIDRTYQLNFGGNMDFYNMLERDRLESKKISKTNAVTSQLPREFVVENIHVGPSDYVPWLTDRKIAHIRIEGRAFGYVPLNLELKLEVWDSPNSAGVIIDAVRCAKLAMDRGQSGPLAVSSYFMKSPPVQLDDETARLVVENFIYGTDY